MEVYLKWIVDAWDQLPKDLIIKSFKGCGLTNALDGSEDCQIHCFGSDGPIQTGLQLLQQARANAGDDERGLTQKFDADAESDVSDEDSYNSHVSLDFHL